MEGNKIAIIITLFNKSKYLERALLSVVNQSKSFDEIIIVDDKSTDNSVDLVSKFITLHFDFPIRLVKHDINKGPGAARNTGLYSASADFVCFLDADDYLDSSFVEKMSLELNKDLSAGLLIYQVLESRGSVVRPDIKRLEQFCDYSHSDRIVLLNWSDAMVVDSLFSGCNTLINKRIARAITFDEKVRNFEDWDFYFRTCLYAVENNLLIYLCPVVGLIYSDEDIDSLSRTRELSKSLLTLPPLVGNLLLPSNVRRYTAGIWLCHVSQRCTYTQGVRLIWRTMNIELSGRPKLSHCLAAIAGLVIGISAWKRISKIRKYLLYV